MKTRYWTALFIAATTIGWIFLGPSLQGGPTLEGELVDNDAKQAQITPRLENDANQLINSIETTKSSNNIATVRVKTIESSGRSPVLSIRGKTEANRIVNLKSELDAKIVKLPKEKGEWVQRGDVICELELGGLPSALKEAEANLRQAELEYEGTQKLFKTGLQSKIKIATAEAGVATAEAALERVRKNLIDTKIRAPFDGFLEKRPVNIGDYLQRGSICGTILDADPIKIVGEVTEKNIDKISLGNRAQVRLVTGPEFFSRTTFIAKSASDTTRTYRVEFETPNPNGEIAAGITAKIDSTLKEIQAHRITPSILTLTDDGEIGVRIVENGRVRLKLVQIIDETPEGIWVTGLPNIATVIVVGQETVFAGDNVNVVEISATTAKQD